MSGTNLIADSNCNQIYLAQTTIDVASVAANTTAEQTFTVNGLKTTDVVFVRKPSATAGLGVVNARVSAANTLAITFVNATASPINPAAETYLVAVFRPENALPTSVPA